MKLGDNEEGFQEFTIGEKTFKVDIFEALLKFQEMIKSREQFADSPGNLLNDVLEYLKITYSLENLSLFVAAKFFRTVMALAKELKKNIEESVT